MTEPYEPDEPALDRIRALPSWLLNRAAGRGRRLLGEAFAHEGLRMSHHAVLAAVADIGPVAQAALGRETGFDPKDMVGILNDLQRALLVTRTPDPHDRRKNVIALTAEGRSCLERLALLGDEANRALLAALTPAEREQFVALLARVAEEREEGPVV
ncbi:MULTISPECIES: MarR family winged helix-turn-helix transcriptional regulator [Streptomyces]|uniref:MarR family winged helix-turn-helix transcriptional regulator n=1 Tax=Streptomyces TaxID=1883 RepID=UPI00345B87C7